MTSSGDGEESPVCDGFGVRAALVSLGRRMAVAGRRCTGGLSDRVARLRAAVEDRQVDPEDGGRCRAVAARVVAAARPAPGRRGCGSRWGPGSSWGLASPENCWGLGSP